MAPRRLPTVVDDHLLPLDLASGEPIALGSPAWYDWLADPTHPSFSYQTALGSITVRRERKRNGWYWYAYRAHAGRLHKAYLGKAADLTPDRLRSIADTLTEVAVAPSSDVAAHQGAPAIRLSFFGAPQLLRDGRVVALAARKALALLAYQVAQERPQPRAQLLALLWPESEMDRARHVLNQLLYAQRQLFDEDSLFLGKKLLRLNPTLIWTDVAAFEVALSEQRVEDALGYHHGPFLDGFFLGNAPQFDAWAEAQRERLQQRLRECLAQRAARLEATHEWESASRWRRHVLDLDPLDSHASRKLAEALIAAGDRSGAIRSIRRHRELLKTELGLDLDLGFACWLEDLERSPTHH